ncbi:uncharacterized protein LOC141614218 [Silene latifolia]|uniref:uncharacterized protein LOC141614218 n=1 Tax=Silene latifolia TaxID=37657 RepID=UPI003D7850BF
MTLYQCSELLILPGKGLKSNSSYSGFNSGLGLPFFNLIPIDSVKIQVSSSLPSRRIRIRRKNSLRPKILKTLTKPYPDPIPEDLGTRIEPNDYGVVEELEASVGVNEDGLGEVQVVRDVRGTNVMGFKGFPGQTVFKVVVSFVGLFLLQTIVSVWIMGSAASADKDSTDGSVIVGDSGLTSIDELKIAEIRKMVRMVKEDEKRKKNLEKGEGELENESDDDDDEEEEEEEEKKTDNSLRNGIAKEVDGRLTMLRKRSPMPVQNVNFLKKAGSSGKDVRNESVFGKEEYNRLMFEAKRKFRSQVTEVGNKPKGFEGINDVREKDSNGTESERSNLGMGKAEEKSVSQSSEPLQSFKKAAVTEEENPGKGINGSSSLRSDSLINNLSVGMNKSAKPENGILQDSSTRITFDDGAKPKELSVIEIQESQKKKNDLKSSTSAMHAMPRRNEQSGSRKLKSKLSRRTNKDKKKTDAQELWWSTLPCVFAILMQKGHGSKAQQGFYTLHINSDADYESSYTVAFEDQNDARNLCYILDSVFGDLPDAAVDVVMMSTQELKEILNSVNKKVVVARKGELKLYAGQPLEDAESALRLLVK